MKHLALGIALLTVVACAQKPASEDPTYSPTASSQVNDAHKTLSGHGDTVRGHAGAREEHLAGPNTANGDTSPSASNDSTKQNGDSSSNSDKTTAGSPVPLDPSVPDVFNLTSCYSSLMLTLAFPSEQHLGWLRLDGEDAHVLYKALALKPTPTNANDGWNVGNVKTGESVVCYEQSRKSEGNKLVYGCSLYANYYTGEGIKVAYQSEKDSVAKKLTHDYAGTNLDLKAGTDNGEIKLKGADARALFHTLAVTAIKPENTRYKRGENYWCQQITTDAGSDYTCTLNFKVTDGSLKKARLNLL